MYLMVHDTCDEMCLKNILICGCFVHSFSRLTNSFSAPILFLVWPIFNEFDAIRVFRELFKFQVSDVAINSFPFFAELIYSRFRVQHTFIRIHSHKLDRFVHFDKEMSTTLNI